MQGMHYMPPQPIVVDVPTLFRTTAQQEASLKALVRSRPFDLDEIDRHRAIIREGYKNVIRADPSFAANKDVEQSMWKTCFYRKIEDFRKRIRKQAATASTAENRVFAQKARQELHMVCNDFQNFLSEAMNFYVDMLAWFEAMHNVQQHRRRRANSMEGQQLPEGDHDYIKSMHRSLIFLGDLARYRELHSENVRKDWSLAEQYYYKAIDMLPSSGNPHNQLAVLATYTEAECVAVYRYCRALLCEYPFPTAQENLALLFEKNKQNMPESRRQVSELEEEERLRQGLMSGTITGQQAGIARATMLKSFLQRFVRLHGMLFASEQQQQPQDQELDMSNALDVDEFLQMLSMALTDLRQLLKMSAFGDGLLLHMVVICIFSVLQATPQNGNGNGQAQDSVSLTLSLALAFGVAGEIAACVRTTRQESEHTTAKPPGSRLLGPVVVFCDWLTSRRLLWKLRPLAEQPIATAAGPNSVPNGREKDQEARMREQFWITVARIATDLQPQLRPFPHLPEGLVWRPEDGRVLKEQHDLRGFQPLVEVYGRDLMTRPKGELGRVDIVSDDVASSWRTVRLMHFLQTVGGNARTVTWNESGGGLLLFSALGRDGGVLGPPTAALTMMSLSSSSMMNMAQHHQGVMGQQQQQQQIAMQQQEQQKHRAMMAAYNARMETPHRSPDRADDDEGGDEVILFKPSFATGSGRQTSGQPQQEEQIGALDDSANLPRDVLESMLGGLLDCSDSGPHPPAHAHTHTYTHLNANSMPAMGAPTGAGPPVSDVYGYAGQPQAPTHAHSTSTHTGVSAHTHTHHQQQQQQPGGGGVSMSGAHTHAVPPPGLGPSLVRGASAESMFTPGPSPFFPQSLHQQQQQVGGGQSWTSAPTAPARSISNPSPQQQQQLQQQQHQQASQWTSFGGAGMGVFSGVGVGLGSGSNGMSAAPSTRTAGAGITPPPGFDTRSSEPPSHPHPTAHTHTHTSGTLTYPAPAPGLSTFASPNIFDMGTHAHQNGGTHAHPSSAYHPFSGGVGGYMGGLTMEDGGNNEGGHGAGAQMPMNTKNPFVLSNGRLM